MATASLITLTPSTAALNLCVLTERDCSAPCNMSGWYSEGWWLHVNVLCAGRMFMYDKVYWKYWSQCSHIISIFLSLQEWKYTCSKQNRLKTSAALNHSVLHAQDCSWWGLYHSCWISTSTVNSYGGWLCNIYRSLDYRFLFSADFLLELSCMPAGGKGWP